MPRFDDDLKRQMEEAMRSGNLTDREQQKTLKALEMIQELQTPEGRRKNALRLAASVAVPILGIIAFIVGIFFAITWYTSTVVEQTVEVPGDPTRFDPVASLDAVRAFAGEGATLTSIDAQYVRPDGTMDLTASYRPTVAYDFSREVPPPEDAPPVGAGTAPDGTWYEPVTVTAYEPGQWRHVKTFGQVSSEYSYRNRGMERDVSQPVSSPPQSTIIDPACAFADLWKTAIDRGAPSTAVASITYDSRGYMFSIRDTDVRLTFGTDCTLKQ